MRLAWLLVSVLTAGCSPALGHFASGGGILGKWKTNADYCASSVTTTEQGTTTVVTFGHRSGGALTFQLSAAAVGGKPTSVAVERADPSRHLDLDPTRCTRFDVRQRPSNGRFGADIDLDCAAPDGTRVTASLHAAECD